MYLYKKHYVKNWDHMKPEELHDVSVTKGGQESTIRKDRVVFITEQVAYWRKANAIHQWFVKNVQEGIDNSSDYYVSRDLLKELLNEVDLSLKARHLAPALLPTQEGFFFGSQEYDEYYWQDMEDTKKTLTEILAEPKGGDFYYSSSW